MAVKKARELNDVIRYTMWSVFRLRDLIGDADRTGEVAEVQELFAKLEAADTVIRGVYDVSACARTPT
jgi:chlorite dismutase